MRFPQEEVGKMRKLSRPWHGPYCVLSKEEPDITVAKVYFPQDKTIRVHMSRVTPCPSELPPGFYWYGTKRHSAGRPPKWVQQLLSKDAEVSVNDVSEESDPLATSDSGDTDNDEPQETSDGSGEAESEAAVNTTPRPRDQERYSLRSRVTAPKRLMVVQTRSRSSLSVRGE